MRRSPPPLPLQSPQPPITTTIRMWRRRASMALPPVERALCAATCATCGATCRNCCGASLLQCLGFLLNFLVFGLAG
ncbi:hypothetical protein E1A91_D08G067000v1 [Gossypium mustelinum]|uniref:Uncharacterized protein n=1 Tax=Gossypium mustelinum TaxID=34275 RepID=A0A5D2TTV6_GOSMU|nr:hypothetical protein E1A91_D08G067000v1 [Gossypium mustelinum]